MMLIVVSCPRHQIDPLVKVTETILDQSQLPR